MNRFDMHAADLAGATRYYEERGVQGLFEGYCWSGRVEELRAAEGEVWGARTITTDAAGVRRQSVYVLAGGRGKGHFSRYVEQTDLPFVTAPGCELEEFFTKRGVPYVVAGRFTETREYRAIAEHYGDRRAARSEVLYMHHIDEGLAVLRAVGASDRAWRAWCLHPIVQPDEALAASYPRVAALTDDPCVLTLAMEYRHIANSCLSHHAIASAAAIALGPLPEVADMLRADKVQNYKDFLLHHRDTHPRREALDRYFRLWLERLGVTGEAFSRFFAALQPGPDKVPCPARP
jgi:hypothetical protein